MGQSVCFSNTFLPNIWLQSFEYCFMENHGEYWAPNICILSSVFLTGYKIGRVVHLNARNLTFARQRSNLWMKILILTLKSDWMFDYTLSFKLNWKIFKCIGTNRNQFHASRAVGSRKLFYGGGGDRGGDEGRAEEKCRPSWLAEKLKKKHLLKRPKTVPKKWI